MSFSNVGALMWIMLHSFAEKIKPDTFTSNKEDVVDFLKDFYNSELHCEACRIDSVNYLDNYKPLNTQADFKKYMFDFHQNVNSKLHKRVFDESILLQYESVNITDVFSLFIPKCRSEKVRTFLTTHDSWFNQ